MDIVIFMKVYGKLRKYRFLFCLVYTCTSAQIINYSWDEGVHYIVRITFWISQSRGHNKQMRCHLKLVAEEL